MVLKSLHFLKQAIKSFTLWELLVGLRLTGIYFWRKKNNDSFSRGMYPCFLPNERAPCVAALSKWRRALYCL